MESYSHHIWTVAIPLKEKSIGCSSSVAMTLLLRVHMALKNLVVSTYVRTMVAKFGQKMQFFERIPPGTPTQMLVNFCLRGHVTMKNLCL